MANYKETVAQSTSWVRSNFININNPLNGTPSVQFWTEKVVQSEDGSIVSAAENKFLNVPFSQNETFQLYDPVTGDAIEGQTATHAQIYVLLFSLFMDSAIKRDQGLI